SSYLGDQRVFRHHLYLNVSYFPAPLNVQIPHVFFFFFLFLLDPNCRPVLISLPLCRCCCHIHHYHTASALPVLCAWLAHSGRHSCFSCFILIIRLGYRCFLVF